MDLNTKRTIPFLAGKTCIPVMVVVIALGIVLNAHSVPGKQSAHSEIAPPATAPWTDAQTVTPAKLAKEIANSTGANRPAIVCSGFRVLYKGAHAPGAVYHGPASKPDGLDNLKKWAQEIPRSANLVVYCGCCPFNVCPNIRPAFEALRSMGFQRLRVLVLPNSFARDWVAHGYPLEGDESDKYAASPNS
jgi:thiosulfate/3-mercaptopyruvate sulfurtransferase